MNHNFKLLLIFCILLFTLPVKAQDAVKSKAKLEAEKMSKSLLNGNYEQLMEYTHPNVIKFSGGKQKMIDLIRNQMKSMADNGFSIDSVMIRDNVQVKLHKNEYQALLPKTTFMNANGQVILSEDYLYGFSDNKGQKWTFVEAEQMKSAAAKKIFPDFEPQIEIPAKDAPLTIDEEGAIEVLEFDENEGTYADPYQTGEKIGYYVGLIAGLLFFIGVVAGLILLIVYLIKRNKKTKKIVEEVPTKSPFKKVEKITCTQCDKENSRASKYCNFCGYTLPR